MRKLNVLHNVISCLLSIYTFIAIIGLKFSTNPIFKNFKTDFNVAEYANAVCFQGFSRNPLRFYTFITSNFDRGPIFQGCRQIFLFAREGELSDVKGVKDPAVLRRVNPEDEDPWLRRFKRRRRKKRKIIERRVYFDGPRPDVEYNLVDKGNFTESLSMTSNRSLHVILSLTSSHFLPKSYHFIHVLRGLNEVRNIGPENVIPNQYPGKPSGNLYGMFVTGLDDVIEKFILSVPLAVLNRFPKTFAIPPEVVLKDDTTVCVTLGFGFLRRVYDSLIRPSLLDAIEGITTYRINEPCGIMDYLEGADLDKISSLVNEEVAISKDELKSTVRKTNPLHPRKKKVPLSNLISLSARRRMSILIKCARDRTFVDSCSILLGSLLGRVPRKKELAYALGYKKLSTFNEHYNLCVNESELRFCAFSDAFADIITAQLWRKTKKVADKEFKIAKVIFCHKAIREEIRQRFFSIHINTLENLDTNIMEYFFTVGFNTGRRVYTELGLPLFLPYGTMQLAKKSIEVIEELTAKMEDVIDEYRNARRMNLPIGPDNFDDEFKKKVLKIEMKYDKTNKHDNKVNVVCGSQGNTEIHDTQECGKGLSSLTQNSTICPAEVPGDYRVSDTIGSDIILEGTKGGDSSIQEYGRYSFIENDLRLAEHDALLNEEVSTIVGEDIDRIRDALDAYETKIVDPSDPIGYADNADIHTDGIVHGPSTSRTYADLDPMHVPDPPDRDINLIRARVLRSSLRLLAVEALDDRLARFIFMAIHGLFVQGVWDINDIIKTTQIKGGPKMVEFILYLATLRCKEYEYWRIKLNLPPYINEWTVNPKILQNTPIDPANLPHHIKIAIKENAKKNLLPSIFKVRTPPEGGRKKKYNRMQRDKYSRMKNIKPKLSNLSDLVKNIDKIKDLQKILDKSPINYLADSGILDHIEQAFPD